MSQRSFASAEYALKKKRTRREQFLAEMERIVPWSRLEAAIVPSYPSGGRVGRPPIGVPKMLRMYCLQQWHGLADEALEDAQTLPPRQDWISARSPCGASAYSAATWTRCRVRPEQLMRRSTPPR